MNRVISFVKKKICDVLGIPPEKLDKLIDEIKAEYGISDIAAVSEIIARNNLADKLGKSILYLKIATMLRPIGSLRGGMRGVSVVGRIEALKLFDASRNKKLMGILLISDGKGWGQIYIPQEERFYAIIKNTGIGDIVYVENVVVGGILRGGIRRITITSQSTISLLDDKDLELLELAIPKIRIYDVGSIVANASAAEHFYYHIEGIFMGVYSNKKQPAQKHVVLGSLRDYGRTRVILVLKDKAVEEFNSMNFKVGDIIRFHGVYPKRYGSSVFIFARNLSTFEKRTVFFIEPKAVGERGWWTYKARIISAVIIRKYKKKESISRYATFLAKLENNETVRVVVWNDGLVNMLGSLGKGALVKVFGQVRFGRNFVELHIQENFGAITILEQEESFIPVEGYTKVTVVTDLNELEKGDLIHFIGKIVEVNEVTSERLRGVAILSDGDREIRFLIWNDKTLETLMENINSLVRIDMVKVAEDRRESDKLLLMETQKTSIEVIASNYTYDSELNISEILYADYGFLDSVPVGEQTWIYGQITSVEWRGKIAFCGICGGLIVDPEKQVCELGHVGKAVEKDVLVVVLDDGFGEKSVMIPMDIIDKQKFEGDFETLLRLAIGKNLCVKGKLRVDVSTGKPVKIFIAEEKCDILGIENYWGGLLKFFSREV